jgi:pyruvate/2-oxoglutarate dehydrogenase complex dihydrolipoamide dehydrogenase (E3) component
MPKPYDIVIIGAGSTGLTAADFAIQLGARVALVEKDRTGGECTWTGCVPSKTLLKAARVAHHMRTAGRYGLPHVEPAVDLKSVMAHVWAVVNEVYHEESPDALHAAGIDVFLDAAQFLDPHTVATGEETLSARHVLIATGAHPFLPPVGGLESVDCLTYETIWDLQVLPKRLLVLGAGPIGCEMAQAFRRFGAQVTLLSSRDRVLPRDDPAASRVLAQVFEAEGVDVRANARAERAWQDKDGIHLLAGGDELMGDALFVAAGRRPNVAGLGLEEAGVSYSDEGIQVDENPRTSARHIYAAGDCIGRHQFTHYAGWQAVIAVRNALLPGASKGIPEQVPWTTFTDPEVAHAGLTEAQARTQSIPPIRPPVGRLQPPSGWSGCWAGRPVGSCVAWPASCGERHRSLARQHRQPVRNHVFHAITRSLCPECRRVVDAQVLIREGAIYLRKRCPEHGLHEALVSSDADWNLSALRYNKPGAIPFHDRGPAGRAAGHGGWRAPQATGRRTGRRVGPAGSGRPGSGRGQAAGPPGRRVDRRRRGGLCAHRRQETPVSMITSALNDKAHTRQSEEGAP